MRVTVEVHKAGPLGDPIAPNVAGFCLEYDSADGPKRTAWQDVEPGDGWTTYSFDLPNASFSNRGGFDLLINSWGAKQDLTFGGVKVQRLEKDPGTVPVTTASVPPIEGAALRSVQ